MGAILFLVGAVVFLVLLLVAGLLYFPVFTGVVAIPIVCIALIGWYIGCGYQGVPWFRWAHVPLPRPQGGSYIHIILLGLMEIRWVPQNYVWVVSFGHSDPTQRRGYKVFHEGWWLVWLPKFLSFSLGFVSLRPFNLDLKRVKVNTNTTPVEVDSQVTIKVSDAHLFAVSLQEPIEEVVTEILSAVLNYVTAGYDAIKVIELDSTSLQEMAGRATRLLNGDEGAPDGKAINSLKAYGAEAVVRIQNIIGVPEVMSNLAAREATILRADAGIEAAVRDAKAAEHLGDSIAAIREKADLPPGSAYNLAPLLLAGLVSRTNAGNLGLELPKGQVGFDMGGVRLGKDDPSGSKESKGSRDKSSDDEASEDKDKKNRKGGK